MVGKTNMDQFAAGLVGTRTPFGTARNAFDERSVPASASLAASTRPAQHWRRHTLPISQEPALPKAGILQVSKCPQLALQQASLIGCSGLPRTFSRHNSWHVLHES